MSTVTMSTHAILPSLTSSVQHFAVTAAMADAD
jgi:hypothetical protein